MLLCGTDEDCTTPPCISIVIPRQYGSLDSENGRSMTLQRGVTELKGKVVVNAGGCIRGGGAVVGVKGCK